MTTPGKPSIGSIALIGGGPGDVDLLTLRAVERLRAAEIILYDDLAGDAEQPVVERDEHTLLATEVCTYLDHAFRFRNTQHDGITWLQGLPGMLKQQREGTP